MGRAIGDVLRCSSSAVHQGIAERAARSRWHCASLRPLGQGREVSIGCGRRRKPSMCSINRRRAATFWQDRPSLPTMSISGRALAPRVAGFKSDGRDQIGISGRLPSEYEDAFQVQREATSAGPWRRNPLPIERTSTCLPTAPLISPDSPLEGSGFELPVPRCALIVNSAALVAPPHSAVAAAP